MISSQRLFHHLILSIPFAIIQPYSVLLTFAFVFCPCAFFSAVYAFQAHARIQFIHAANENDNNHFCKTFCCSCVTFTASECVCVCVYGIYFNGGIVEHTHHTVSHTTPNGMYIENLIIAKLSNYVHFCNRRNETRIVPTRICMC